VAGHFDRSAALAFSPEEWVRFCDGVMELAERAVMMGLVTAFHPHAGTYVETAEEITEVLERTSADLVGLCVDTGHLLFGGVDPRVLMVRYSTRVRHVHLKDVSQSVLEAVRLEKPSYLEAVSRGIFVPLGEGMVDIGSLLSTLQATGYEGWVVLEQDVRLKLPRDQDLPRRNAQRSRQVLLRFGV
jgi:inosose dehydratase